MSANHDARPDPSETDPLSRPCEGCGAEPGEECTPLSMCGAE